MKKDSKFRSTPDGLIFSSDFRSQSFARGGRVTTILQPQEHGSDNPRATSCFQSRVAFAANILDTFPIVRRQDKAALGCNRTKTMVLAYYNALAAGDTDVEVAA